jgi:hypothetical protein
MRKRGRGALYPGSSGKGTPRAVARATWLGRGPTATVSIISGWLKTRRALASPVPRALTEASCQQVTGQLPAYRLRSFNAGRCRPAACCALAGCLAYTGLLPAGIQVPEMHPSPAPPYLPRRRKQSSFRAGFVFWGAIHAFRVRR